MNYKSLLFLWSLLVCTSLFAQNQTKVYIESYREIAISECQRTGIPASIKLAQGILESNSGRSTLATEANNHFGIKCGKKWMGEFYFREDDDYHNGKLVKSCFRKFKNSFASYIAHSDFLTDQNKTRYQFLFDIPKWDYQSWAHGLKKSGYATDPKYAYKLISLIEKYELFKFDQDIALINTESIVRIDNIKEENTANHKEQSPPQTSKSNYTEKPTQSVNSMLRPVHDNKKNTDMSKNITVFHVVQSNENLFDIAKKYKTDVQLLAFQNRIRSTDQLKAGTKIKIEGFRHFFKKAKTNKEKKKQKDLLFQENPLIIMTD